MSSVRVHRTTAAALGHGGSPLVVGCRPPADRQPVHDRSAAGPSCRPI